MAQATLYFGLVRGLRLRPERGVLFVVRFGIPRDQINLTCSTYLPTYLNTPKNYLITMRYFQLRFFMRHIAVR